MTDRQFCDLYNAYYGHGGIDKMDKPEQLTFQRFKGRELKEFADHVEKQSILKFMTWYAGDENNKMPEGMEKVLAIYFE